LDETIFAVDAKCMTKGRPLIGWFGNSALNSRTTAGAEHHHKLPPVTPSPQRPALTLSHSHLAVRLNCAAIFVMASQRVFQLGLRRAAVPGAPKVQPAGRMVQRRYVTLFIFASSGPCCPTFAFAKTKIQD
jgi:hypothetical protein